MRILIVALAAFLQCDAVTLYVKSNVHQKCPESAASSSPCEHLSFYIQHTEEYFISNTTFIFLRGTHELEFNDRIHLENISHFTLTSDQEITEGVPTIQCVGTRRSGFYFTNSSEIFISNLMISQCGMHLVNNVHAALALDTVYNVTISGVTIRDCKAFGLHADRTFGKVLVSKSKFLNNTGDSAVYGGNVRFWYDYRHCNSKSETDLVIESSQFIGGYDVLNKYGYYYPTATGLTLLISCPFIHVNITNITAYNNLADDGGNVAISLDFKNYRENIGSVSLRNSLIQAGTGHRGGGLRVWSYARLKSGSTTCSNISRTYTTLHVENVSFVGNQARVGGGALYISHYEQEHVDCVLRQILFTNCTFSENHVPAFGNGGVMEVIKHKISRYIPHVSPQFEITFNNSIFTNNWNILDQRKSIHGAILDIFAVDRITFNCCNFTDNNSTTLSAVDSNLVFLGHILFKNNSGVNGGALKFCDSSIVYLRNTYVLFEGNHAHAAGGAIYAEQRCLETASPCFFQPEVPGVVTFKNLSSMVKLKFINNTANFAGTAIYGGTVDYCYTFQSFNRSYFHSKAVFDSIVDTSDEQSSSPISSDPVGVCLCDHSNDLVEINCNKKRLELDVFPGRTFRISAASVGQRNGTVPAVIKGLVVDDQNSSTTILYPNKTNLLVPTKGCVWLDFSIQSNESIVKFNLTVEQFNANGASFYYKFHPPQVIVNLTSCPWGFTSHNSLCICKRDVRRKDIYCNNDTQVITRQGRIWIGYNLFRSVDQENIIVHRLCPYNYCNLENVSVNFTTTDSQCANHRVGMLCGACGDNKSVSLGGSHCLKCSKSSVALVILFVFMGLFLVLFLIAFNLTVTEGTVNALIFYVNMIQINRDVYFPGSEFPFPIQLLRGFISWLNLDFGFVACFYKGMDTYAKVWLQFVFPIYIWFIVVVIVYLSRRFYAVQRLIGKNAVKILATLFLLSTAKLSRTVILTMSYQSVSLSPEDRVDLWTLDGNVPYLRGKHIPLFLTGVLFLMLIFMYSSLLAFIQCLVRVPNKRPFTFISHLKPFFDAYTGPYKDVCRFWTGFLLFVRMVLFFLFSLNALDDPTVKLTFTSFSCFLILALLSCFRGVYKKAHLDFLEALSFFNLGTLSVISCYFTSSGVNQTGLLIAGGVSVAVCAATFFTIITFHGYNQLKDMKGGCCSVKNSFKSYWYSVRYSQDFECLTNSSVCPSAIPRAATTSTEVFVSTPEECSLQAKQLQQQQNINTDKPMIPVVIRYDRCREPLLECEEDSDNNN